MDRVTIRPHDPQHLCPKCGSEGARPQYHAQSFIATFGSTPPWPCVRPVPDDLVGEHLCNRCEVCSFAWMESVSEGMAQDPG